MRIEAVLPQKLSQKLRGNDNGGTGSRRVPAEAHGRMLREDTENARVIAV